MITSYTKFLLDPIIFYERFTLIIGILLSGVFLIFFDSTKKDFDPFNSNSSFDFLINYILGITEH